jgi:hypothetical protein
MTEEQLHGMFHDILKNGTVYRGYYAPNAEHYVFKKVSDNEVVLWVNDTAQSYYDIEELFEPDYFHIAFMEKCNFHAENNNYNKFI